MSLSAMRRHLKTVRPSPESPAFLIRPMAMKLLSGLVVVLLLVATASLGRAEGEKKSFTDWVLHGYEMERQGRFAEAVQAYTKALEINEESPTATIRRAICAAKDGQLERAAMDLREAAMLTPVSLTDYTTMAWVMATSPIKSVRDGTRAVTFAQKALNDSPSAETYDILAAAYAEMGNFHRARNVLTEGLKKFPNSPRVPAMRERLTLYNERKPFREVWLEDNKSERRLQNRIEFPR